MSGKTEKKFRKMHRKRLNNIADMDFKKFSKDIIRSQKMLKRENIILKILLITFSIVIALLSARILINA